MKALLTSSGITNPSIEAALVELLSKPIAESTALIVPTGIYPLSVGPEMAGRLMRGEVNGGFVDFSLIVHLDDPDRGDVSVASAATWAARLPVRTYAIDERTAVKGTSDTEEVVTEGHGKLFEPT